MIKRILVRRLSHQKYKNESIYLSNNMSSCQQNDQSTIYHQTFKNRQTR